MSQQLDRTVCFDGVSRAMRANALYSVILQWHTNARLLVNVFYIDKPSDLLSFSFFFSQPQQNQMDDNHLFNGEQLLLLLLMNTNGGGCFDGFRMIQ